MAAGAILRFAVEDNISGVDLSMVGLILIAAGAVGFLAGMAMAFGARDPRDPRYREP